MWPFKKKLKIKNDISVIDFYTMLRHYERRSTNIAVMKDKKSFKNLIKHFKNNVKPIREDKIIKISDEKYVFIINDIDRTIMFFERIEDLDNSKMVFGKYI